MSGKEEPGGKMSETEPFGETQPLDLIPSSQVSLGRNCESGEELEGAKTITRDEVNGTERSRILTAEELSKEISQNTLKSPTKG